MSDHIYGSSLTAAKSKANYLFEGDFRRRPNQNLAGASTSLDRVQLLQQAAQERQTREDVRRKENAAILIQSVWRAHCSRRSLSSSMRVKFDKLMITTKHYNKSDCDVMLGEFITCYNSKYDENRFNLLIDYLLANQESVVDCIKSEKNSNTWLYRLMRLLKINLRLIGKISHSTESRQLKFFEQFTRPQSVLSESQSAILWYTLIINRYFETMRQLVDNNSTTNRSNTVTKNTSGSHHDQLVIELIRRCLDAKLSSKDRERAKPAYSFISQFLRGHLDHSLEVDFLPKLLELSPRALNIREVLSEFEILRAGDKEHFFSIKNLCKSTKRSRGNLIDLEQFESCKILIWLCYAFVKTVHTQVDQLSDKEKACYINLLSLMLLPAEHIIKVSQMLASCRDPNNELDDEYPTGTHALVESSTYTAQDKKCLGHQHEIKDVIANLVNLINNQAHINGLKSVLFNKDFQSTIQGSVVKICNLMLCNEPLAIFNCLLIYTVAFSREFSKNLWKSIITPTTISQFGQNTQIYVHLTQGYNVSHECWDSIIPQLRLFCSLYTYLLPTLDDDEFYSDEQSEVFADSIEGSSHNQHQQHHDRQDQSIETRTKSNKYHDTIRDPSNGIFFKDKELVHICAILRDLCVGLIEILYQDTRYSQHSTQPDFLNYQDERTRLLSFEIRLCFKALVRLIRQLHARDSRKPFCPNDHWICPAVSIPTNKAIDFQLIASEQGRLLNKVTQDNNGQQEAGTGTTPLEIKTLLILQEIPFVVPFHERVQMLHQLLNRERRMNQPEGYHFGLPGTAIQVEIRRTYIYEDAFEKLSYEREPNMKLPLKISLINAAGVEEAGIDGGGVTKEFLCELLKAGFDPMRGFFKSTKDNMLYPNPSARVLFANNLEVHYEFLGKMLGKAIFEKIMVELPMANFFLSKILARRYSSDIDMQNLASLDPILYKNLVYLKNYDGDVADLNLDFSISNNELDEHEVVELKPGGSRIPVTHENKIEYVHLVADYRLNKQIRTQCAAFKKGLAQLIDLDWLRMFDPRELQILISGAPMSIDTHDWRRNTLYANGYSDHCEAINTFWRVVDDLDEHNKRKLLKFATSCSSPPLLGFKDLFPQFTIAPSEGSRLPTASTCMNLLKLPMCEDEDAMRSKLLYAIESNSGFELS